MSIKHFWTWQFLLECCSVNGRSDIVGFYSPWGIHGIQAVFGVIDGGSCAAAELCCLFCHRWIKRSSGEPHCRPQVSPPRAAVRYCYSIFLFSMAERQQTAFAGAAAPSITIPKHNQCAQFQREAAGNK